MRKSSGPRLRIVVDTNVFISGAILKQGNPYALRQAWHTGTFVLILSSYQRGEIERVLNRPKIAVAYGLSFEERASLLRRLDSDGELVDPQTTLPVPLRDPKDVRILGTALAADADYLVTGDDDLHAVAGDPRLDTLKIVSVAEFLAILSERGPSEVEHDDGAEPEGRASNGTDES